MQKKYDVYGIGNALMDVAFKVSDTFLEEQGVKKGVMTLVDEATQSHLISAINHTEMIQDPGGSAANSIMALSQLGGRGFYSCKVASDAFGDAYIGDMQAAGIDTNFDQQGKPEGTTGTCLVMITDDAERTMNTYLGINATLSTREVDESAIKDSTYVYIEGYMAAGESSFKAMKRVKEIADENDVQTALTLSDPSIVEGFKERLTEITSVPVDLIFCNEEEAKLYTGTDNLSEAREKLKEAAQNLIITCGSDGAIIYDGNIFIKVEPFEVEAIDTNGAGDIFAGAFLYGITNGMEFPEAGKLANLAASRVVSRYGPRLTKEEMQDVLEELK
jgi:sugar/nucleoside kinase (ribokinase family)